MNDGLQQKFAALLSEYKQKLPEKINEIIAEWQALESHWNEKKLADFHTKIHGLKGASRIYGFKTVGLISEQIEKLCAALIKQNKIDDNIIKQVNKLLQELKNTPLEQDKDIFDKLNIPALNATVVDNVPMSGNKKIFFLIQETNMNVDLQALKDAGYDSSVFNSLYPFTNTLLTEKADVLLIDIDEVLDLQEQEIAELKEKYIKNTPIIFLARSSDFPFRLAAAKLQGKSFLLVPFSSQELIRELDNISASLERHFRVLIIDDQAEVASYYATILLEAGMQTHIITNPKEVDRALHEFKPELIISDFHMPECDGLQLAAIIRQQKLYEALPFIFLSSEKDKLAQLKAMSSGADDFIVKETEPEHLVLAVTNKAQRYRKLQELIHEDPLTGLINKKSLIDALDEEIKSSRLLNRQFCLALVDIDHFKSINQNYGHAAGDQVLKTLSFIITEKLRPKDIASRYGDEEFLLILPETSLEQATTLVESIRTEFEATSFWWDYRLFTASLTATIAAYPTFADAQQLLSAVYQHIKKTHKNTVSAVAEKSQEIP